MSLKEKINNEFVQLQAKVHSVNNVDGKKNEIGKGINQTVVKNTKNEEYIHSSFNKKVVRNTMKRKHGKLHGIRTYDICKAFLACFDDKR